MTNSFLKNTLVTNQRNALPNIYYNLKNYINNNLNLLNFAIDENLISLQNINTNTNMSKGKKEET